MQKTKITQKDFDDLFEIEEGITEETEVKLVAVPEKQDTTPENILSDEEQEFDDVLIEEMNLVD